MQHTKSGHLKEYVVIRSASMATGVHLQGYGGSSEIYNNVLLHKKGGEFCFVFKSWYAQALKSRDITLLTKVHIVKTMVSLVVMNGWETWALKKAEC